MVYMVHDYQEYVLSPFVRDLEPEPVCPHSLRNKQLPYSKIRGWMQPHTDLNYSPYSFLSALPFYASSFKSWSSHRQTKQTSLCRCGRRLASNVHTMSSFHSFHVDVWLRLTVRQTLRAKVVLIFSIFLKCTRLNSAEWKGFAFWTDFKGDWRQTQLTPLAREAVR